MRLPLESVPNFSEGRERDTIEVLGRTLGARARLLDVHADPDHNRSVFTLVGEETELVESLLAGIACARDRIDLRAHEGVHPWIGAADVVPIVPVDPGDMERARCCAVDVARRVGDELELPVFLYGENAPGRGPAFFRRGGPPGLERRIAAGELEPDFGPRTLDHRAGAVLVGARRPLVAFNVNLRGRLEAAQEIARLVRERDGGFTGVRALGLELPRARLVQVSMNVQSPAGTALHDVVAAIRRAATERGAEVVGSELVGLMPAAFALAAAGAALGLERLDASRVLELRLVEG